MQLIRNSEQPTARQAAIEAARAEDAGKGFAVVASDVKALAMQTTKATKAIASQMQEISSRTELTVDSISIVTDTIVRVSEIVSSIAVSVEQQGGATREIAM